MVVRDADHVLAFVHIASVEAGHVSRICSRIHCYDVSQFKAGLPKLFRRDIQYDMAVLFDIDHLAGDLSVLAARGGERQHEQEHDPYYDTFFHERFPFLIRACHAIAQAASAANTITTGTAGKCFSLLRISSDFSPPVK